MKQIQRRPRAVVERVLRGWLDGERVEDLVAAAGAPVASVRRWIEWADLPSRPRGGFWGPVKARWIRRHAGTPINVPAAAVEPPPLPPQIDLSALHDAGSRREVLATLERRGFRYERRGSTIELLENFL